MVEVLGRRARASSPDPVGTTLNKLGFRHVGEQMDEIDGKELVFELGL